MTPPRPVRIGVRLDPEPDDLGNWLTDATAFEAAGADALFVDIAPGNALDPLVLTAALAARTYRTMLVTALRRDDVASPAAAQRLATLGRLGHGRIRLIDDGAGPDPMAGDAALDPMAGDAALDPMAGDAGLALFRRVPGEPGAFEHSPDPEARQRWVTVAAPDGRPAWAATLADVAERGLDGLVVPAGPRLLDLLRNPDEPDDRRDLLIAQG